MKNRASIAQPTIEPLLHGVAAYAEGAKIGPAQWPHHDLIVVTRGGVTFSVGDQVLECGPDSALLLPPRHSFLGHPRAGGCGIWVQHFRVLGSQTGLPRRPVVLTVSNEWARALMKQASAWQRSRKEADARTGIILALLLDALREQNFSRTEVDPITQRIQSALDWLEGQVHSLPGITDLANRTGWSVSQFRQHFRKVCGQTVGSHLRERRLNEAARLLAESDLSIKEISAQVGYADPVAFHRAFTTHASMPPARYRRSIPRVA